MFSPAVSDTRSALTMTAQGVTEFATVNVKDFEGLRFRRVWNPLEGELISALDENI